MSLLDFADEESVVQTRFATTTLALLRAALGHDMTAAADDAERALAAPLPLDPGAVEQITFLGTGWTLGLANEAALKCREAAQLWTESYPAMEYRHGPISIAQAGRAVWPFGPAAARPRRPGRAPPAPRWWTPVTSTRWPRSSSPSAALWPAAERRGLDPDRPRNLTRSVILASTEMTA